MSYDKADDLRYLSEIVGALATWHEAKERRRLLEQQQLEQEGGQP